MGKKKKKWSGNVEVLAKRRAAGLFLNQRALYEIEKAERVNGPHIQSTITLARHLAVKWLNNNGFSVKVNGTSNQQIMDMLLSAENLPTSLKLASERWKKENWWASVIAHFAPPATLDKHWPNFPLEMRQAAKQKDPEPAFKKPRRETGGFYDSDEWRRLRYRVLKVYGTDCMCCGATAGPGRPPHVDHIYPRSRYPKLALSFDNLQVLCVDCNMGKGAWDETDWRPK
jgi:5-methylcytosine-specific restriction endonuclease McrA